MNEIQKLFDKLQNIDESLNDIVCVFIFRKFNNTIGLKNCNNLGFWFPYKVATQEKTWNTVAEEILQVWKVDKLSSVNITNLIFESRK